MSITFIKVWFGKHNMSCTYGIRIRHIYMFFFLYCHFLVHLLLIHLNINLKNVRTSLFYFLYIFVLCSINKLTHVGSGRAYIQCEVKLNTILYRYGLWSDPSVMMHKMLSSFLEQSIGTN